MFEVGSRKRLSGAWCAQGKKMQEYMGRNILLACRPASAQLEISLSLGKSGAVAKGASAREGFLYFVVIRQETQGLPPSVRHTGS